MTDLQQLHDQLSFLDAVSQRVTALQIKIRAKLRSTPHNYCEACRLVVEPKVSSTTTKNIETTFTDAGYGDDDMVGIVTRIHLTLSCPHCGRVLSRTSHIQKIEDERPRRG